MISIICPYNNERIMEFYLKKSLKSQTYQDYEFIPLNNKELNLYSASEVLNYGFDHSTGDIVIFSHQDICLLKDDILENIVSFCENHNFGIAGVAGVSVVKHKVYSSVTHGPKLEQAGEKIEKVSIVDALDECFFFLMRSQFSRFTDLGPVWHLYAIEYSLRCILRGEAIYVVPLPVYHLSPGYSLDKMFWKTLLKIGKIYKKKINIIPTTFGIYKNNTFLPIYIYIKRIFIKIKT